MHWINHSHLVTRGAIKRDLVVRKFTCNNLLLGLGLFVNCPGEEVVVHVTRRAGPSELLHL